VTTGGGFQNWQELRTHLIDAYNETPRAETEQEIIEAYELHPAQTTKAALNIATSVQAGTARSGWAVLKSRAQTITTAPSNPTHQGGANREKAIARAEQWIRAAGMHFDSADEVQDELFSTRGNLSAWANDQSLVTQMLDTWANHRPTGMQIERDADTRADKWKNDQARLKQLAAAKAAALAEPDPIPF
jgi:hypothetical protein